MPTRNRINLSEKQVTLIWQQLTGKELPTTEDARIKLIYPGRTNNNNGPDFRDAVIVIDSAFMKGDVEIHVKSSDWYSHGHHRDSEYNNVILHVAMWHDCKSVTTLQNGRSIPVICLSKALQHQAYLMPHYQLPCSEIVQHSDKKILMKLLNTAGEERFKQKALYFRAKLEQEDAGQVLSQGIMRALGYSKNVKPFEELARKVPLSFLESRNGLATKQALLLGMAGLLPSQRGQENPTKEKEVRELEQIWHSLGKQVKTMEENNWSFSHIYPNNSPVRRIVAQSHLIQRYHKSKLLMGMLQLVKETPLPKGHFMLEDGLTVTSNDYWRDHFDFNVRCKTKTSMLLGHSKAGEIVVNVILPFAFSWGEMSNEPELAEKAIAFYNHYPKLTDNAITRHMTRQFCLEGVPGFTACQQQGLIHIFRNYCRGGICLQCPLRS